ncbi:DUF6933 domain-containing protein [Enterococcus gallinarum]|uniref:DUF6933 domain-containing protein n=1 Tax=Enterococcus gallinarum TaxID=1353 RepID=UPI003D6BCC87
MNLIPTKKALPLFSVFPKSKNESPNLERSFYSWHASYFTFNRKKILVLVNGKSFSPIIVVYSFILMITNFSIFYKNVISLMPIYSLFIFKIFIIIIIHIF